MSRSPGRCFSPLMSLTMVTGTWWFSVLFEFEHTGLHSVLPPSMPRVNSNWFGLPFWFCITPRLETSEYPRHARGRKQHPTTTPPNKQPHVVSSGQVPFVGLHMVRPTAKLTCAGTGMPRGGTDANSWHPTPLAAAPSPTGSQSRRAGSARRPLG